jgi:large subunit ribosomal protein L22
LRFSSKELKVRELVLSVVPIGRRKTLEAIWKKQVLFKTITPYGGMMLKRLRPTPQGRAHKVKRSNHVTIVLGSV